MAGTPRRHAGHDVPALQDMSTPPERCGWRRTMRWTEPVPPSAKEGEVSRETGTDAPGSGSDVESPRESPPLRGTKIHAPRRHRDTIHRTRLTDVLRAARPSSVLVVAPAGFGKTSILADWAEIDGRPFAWLSLGTADNDRMVLWAYIAAALTAAGGMTWTSDELSAIARVPDPVGVVIAHLRTDQEMVLVLDDYHAIESEACHESVLRFIELAPANLQVAISSRTAVPLPLARHRASGALVEIGSGDLRFTTEESDAFLNGSLALGLDDGSVVTLTERTEGWPAGLYLAYLSIRRTKDRAAFISGFGGKNRLVGEYLTEQVLTALGPAERDFMLVTSVVDEVNGPLADALTGSEGSAARLVDLERANVFITPLDDRREWYRYHHLLLELLRLELAKTTPETHHDLHIRAATWFEQAGDADRAIQHAIDGDDAERAARLISASYLQALEWGRIESVVGWLERIGDDRIKADARLSIVKAWVMHFLGLHADGAAALADAMASSYVGVLPDGASSVEASAALMGAAFPAGDVGSMLANARRAFELESRPPSPWRTTVHVLLGFALVRDGSFAEAERYLELGSELAIRSDSWMDAVGARVVAGPRRHARRGSVVRRAVRPGGRRPGRRTRRLPDGVRGIRSRRPRWAPGGDGQRLGGSRTPRGDDGRGAHLPRAVVAGRYPPGADAGSVHPRPTGGGGPIVRGGRRDHRRHGRSGVPDDHSTGARAGALRTVASARRTTVRSRARCPAAARRRPLQARGGGPAVRVIQHGALPCPGDLPKTRRDVPGGRDRPSAQAGTAGLIAAMLRGMDGITRVKTRSKG